MKLMRLVVAEKRVKEERVARSESGQIPTNSTDGGGTWQRSCSYVVNGRECNAVEGFLDSTLFQLRMEC